MRKSHILLLLIILFTDISEAQIKATFTLTNPRVENFYFCYDLNVTVPSGQYWAVGSSNIRVNFTTTPNPAGLTVKADNPAINANTNIHNANGYLGMTTTSVASGTAIGLNILTFSSSGFYRFAPGTYRLATIRWNRIDSTVLASMSFRVPPEQFPTTVFDSTVLMTYNTTWNVSNPPGGIAVNLKNNSIIIPTVFNLYQNYPNPFNPVSIIKFDIPKTGIVKLIIYDVLGQETAALVNEQLKPGTYEAEFDGTDYPSGVYFYTLTTETFTQTRKMVLIK